MDIQGYRYVRWRTWLYYAAAVLSLGLLLLLFHWRPRLRVLARCRSCPLGLADILLIRDSCGQQYAIEVLTEQLEEGSLEQPGTDIEENEGRDTIQLYKDEKALLRYYVFEGLRYVWMSRKGAFCPVSTLNEHWTCDDLYRQQRGLSPQEQSARRNVYGQNVIDVPVKSYWRLLFEEVLNPFYVFQVLSIILWLLDRYYYYAGCIFLISAISIAISLYEIHKQSVTLHNMAQLIVSVRLRRDTGAEDMVSSTELVPGDCILIPEEGLLLPCDAALLAGECMVNESMLTGESIPVMKTCLPTGSARYSPEGQGRHTLFCGTHVIQAKRGQQGATEALAVVTRTGFFTAKGDLISSILYPQPLNFRFYQDAIKFLLILGAVALIGTIYSISVLMRSATTMKELVIRSLDIITIVVPPALPAAITTGTIYAQRRLKKDGIFCISPPRINICGKISLFCFDKTGTLTEEGLDVWGVMEGSGAGFGELVPDPRLLPPGQLLSALACCHSVALLRQQLLGDPLELKMIESTGWVLEEPGVEGEFGSAQVLAVMRPPSPELQPQGVSIREPVAIVRRFPFSSALQRMCVVTVAPGGRSACVFLKGAPEMVASLCLRESVPAQFSETLRQFASEGFRVLALAYKPLDGQTDINTMERGALESELQLLGLLVMRNLVKPESADVISTLRQAQIRTVMVTGDNILTAVNVARSCEMVRKDEQVLFVHAAPPTGHAPPLLQFHRAGADGDDDALTQSLYQSSNYYHLAINGQSFSALCEHFPEYLPKVLMRGTVYARMAPDQKTQLVKELQKLNYRVGMCGDGANDCGALRAADAGVSLSEAEASVASPFTSKSDNISCVPLLIREGRCSLVTSFSLFKYMALYSLIQFSSVLILYTVKTNLSDLQFLFFDLVLVTMLAIVMGRGGPSKVLHPQRPPSSLFSMAVLASLLLHTSLLILGQVAALLVTEAQDWFVPLNSTLAGADNLPNLEDTGVFAVSGFQYIIMAVVMTKGHPFKKHFCSNVVFVCVLLVLSGLMCWLVLYPAPFIRRVLLLCDVSDMNYKLLLVALAALNLFTCYLLEVLIDNGMLNCLRKLKGQRQSKKQYKRLDAFLSDSPNWPPLDQPLPSEHSTVWPSVTSKGQSLL
ncbi:cation-transporting ATPase 13A2 isoform X2 [Conger conger]|nr:cation-transporting ATPase 13A2 isoform X2 [Conger conger]XP_061113655.1 cation-transporting ATPase 13A2 isoform X2 [Conger conger]XP_061113656.1 cation-transporting ATPase 13A2 isoform X2 [Conger conger]XP_061113657.1 cation-transporting ATPase 13A2 isoform X2 [Conger conger]